MASADPVRGQVAEFLAPLPGPPCPNNGRSQASSSTGSGSSASANGGSVERIGPGAKYERCRHLGSGNFGDAWLVKSTRSHQYYVVKELKMTPGIGKKVRNLCAIRRSCCKIPFKF